MTITRFCILDMTHEDYDQALSDITDEFHIAWPNNILSTTLADSGTEMLAKHVITTVDWNPVSLQGGALLFDYNESEMHTWKDANVTEEV